MPKTDGSSDDPAYTPDQRCKSALITDRQEILIDCLRAVKAKMPVGRSKEGGKWSKRILKPIMDAVTDLTDFKFTPDHSKLQPLLMSSERGFLRPRPNASEMTGEEEEGSRFNRSMMGDMQVGMRAARDNVESICSGLCEENKQADTFKKLLDTCRSLELEQSLKNTEDELWALSELNHIVDKMDTCVGRRGRVTPVLLEDMYKHAVVIVSKEIMLVLPTSEACMLDTAYMLSRQQLLAMRDTCHMRYGTIMASSLLAQIDDRLVPSVSVLRAVYSWGDDILNNYGRLGYAAIKCFEPLMVGFFLQKFDVLPKRGDFLKFMKGEFAGASCFKPYDGGKETPGTIFVTPNERSGEVRASQILTALEAIVDQVKEPNMFAELFGLHRAWGFPCINERKSFAKTRMFGRTPFKRTSRTDTVLIDLLGALKRWYTMEHLRKHHVAPPLDSDPESPVLRRWCKTVHDINETMYGRVSLSDWSKIDHGQKFVFDYHINTVEGIDDKAISAETNGWDSTRHASVRGYERPDPVHRTRLIEELLMRKEFDPKEILMRIMRRSERALPRSWFSCGLKSKERDMSLLSRLYGILFLEIRTYFTLTEMNLASGIFSYFPQQTMTLSESQLNHRLTSMDNTGGRNVSYAVVNIVLDFEKWNLHFCDENTRGVFEWLDKLYGTPDLFAFSHECFENMIMYLRSAYHKDEKLSESTRAAVDYLESMYYSHLKGIEGLRQKGWTIVTLGLLLMIAYRRGVRVHLTGQGDNQNLKLWIPLPDGVSSEQAELSHLEYIQEYIDDFCRDLDEAAEDIGLPLRLTETWKSYHLSIYGKEWVFQSAIMTMCLKRFARMQEDVNGIIQDIESRLSTLWAAALACPQKGLDIMVPYILAGGFSWAVLQRAFRVNPVHSSLSPPRDSVTTKYKGTAVALARATLMVPPSLGGVVCVPFLSFLMRGFPDELVEALYHVWICTRGTGPSSGTAKCIYSAFHGLEGGFSHATSLMPLTENPCGTHIDCPGSVKKRVEQVIETALKSDEVVNEAIRGMFQPWIQQEGEVVMEALSRVRPRAPRFIADTFSAHYVGEQRSFVGKFDSAVTVLRCCSVGWRFLEECGEIAEKGLKHHHGRIVDLMDHAVREKLIRPCELAQAIREVCWGVAVPLPATPEKAYVRGLKTVVDITLPYPLEQFEFRDASVDLITMSAPHIITTVDFTPGFAHPITDRAVATRGHASPLMSSSTSENKTGKLIPVAASDGAVKKGCRLRSVTGPWVAPEEGSQLRMLMDGLANLRNDLTFEESAVRVGKDPEGVPGHRMGDPYSSHGVALNIRGYISTQTTIDGEKITVLCDPKTELMYIVQGVFFLAIGFQTLRALYSHQMMDRTKRAMVMVARGYVGDACIDRGLWPSAHLGKYTLYGPLPVLRHVRAPRWFFASREDVLEDTVILESPGRFGRQMTLRKPTSGMLEHAEAWSMFNSAKPLAAVDIYPASVPVTKIKPAVKIRRMASGSVGRVVKVFAWRMLREILPGVIYSEASSYLGTVMAHCLRILQPWVFGMWEQVVGCPGVYEQTIDLLGGAEASASSVYSQIGCSQAVRELVSHYLIDCEQTKQMEYLRDHLFFYLRADEMKKRFPTDLLYLNCLACLEMSVELKCLRVALSKASTIANQSVSSRNLEATCYAVHGVFCMSLTDAGYGWAADQLRRRVGKVCYTMGDPDSWTFSPTFDHIPTSPKEPAIGGGIALKCQEEVAIPTSTNLKPLFSASVVPLKDPEYDCIYEAHPGHAGNKGFRSDLLTRGRGTFSAAVYKLLDLLMCRSVIKTKVVLLGEWPGGWLEMLMSDPTCVLAYYLSRGTPSETTPGKMCSRVPPCIVGSPGFLKGKLRGLRYSQSVNDDMTTEACALDTIKGLQSVDSSGWTFFGCDIFITGKATLEDMLNAMVTLGKIFMETSAPEGLLLVKLMSSHHAVADAMIQVLGHFCVPERVVLSRFSSPENTESYLWCRRRQTPSPGLGYFRPASPQVSLRLTRLFDCPRLSMITPDQRLINTPLCLVGGRPPAKAIEYMARRYPWRGPRMFSYATGVPLACIPARHDDLLGALPEMLQSLRGGIAERLVALGVKNANLPQSAGRRWLVKGYHGCDGLRDENLHVFCLLCIWEFLLDPPRSAAQYSARMHEHLRTGFDIQIGSRHGLVNWGVGVGKREYFARSQRAIPLILAWALQSVIARWDPTSPGDVVPATFMRGHSSRMMRGDQVRQAQGAVDAVAEWCRTSGVRRWMDIAAGSGAISCGVASSAEDMLVVAYSKEPNVYEMRSHPRVTLVHRWSTMSDVRERAVNLFPDGARAEGLLLDPPWWATSHFLGAGCGVIVSAFLNAGGRFVVCSAGPGYPGLPIDLLPRARFEVSGSQFYCYEHPERAVEPLGARVFPPGEKGWLDSMKQVPKAKDASS